MFRLAQNFPNPFKSSITIAYELPEQSSVKVIIYDLQGHKIKTFALINKSAGYHEVLWDGTNNQGISLSSGIFTGYKQHR
jgi:flagellar hook assembly protein FlgD